MLGPEQAKKIMYGSDHASHVSEVDDRSEKVILEAEGTMDTKNEIKSMGGGKRKKSVKSRSSLKNRDEISVSGAGTNLNGKNKAANRLKWDSTKHMSIARANREAQQNDDYLSNSEFANSESPSKL